jgi:hypothetical protein
VRLEGLGQLKNPMTSSGIETAAFRKNKEIELLFRFIFSVSRSKFSPSSILNAVSLVCILASWA